MMKRTYKHKPMHSAYDLLTKEQKLIYFDSLKKLAQDVANDLGKDKEAQIQCETSQSGRATLPE
jgi:hypothetical protein